MKQLILISILLVFLIGCTQTQQPEIEQKPDKPELQIYLEQKFSKSSESVIDSVTVDNNIINIELYSQKYSIDETAIDVAIVLNRNPKFIFDNVIIKYKNEQASFTKTLFDQYTTGQINDLQFIQKLQKTKSISEEPKSDVIETLKFPCNGRAGESFYLFTEMESYEIIRPIQISCKKPVEILERDCIQNIGSYEGDIYEMNKVRQGNLVGWAQRSDLTCPDMYCNVAPDSIC